MADMLLHGQRAVPSRLLELGYTFRYPEAAAALRSLLDEKPSHA
jgi:NAD dependent epimerase/dehydratase family enzyme